MRYLNKPLIRRIDDLRDGLYIQPKEYIDDSEALMWLEIRISELSDMVSPMTILIDRLNESWGKIGESGSSEEIHHIVCLIMDHLKQVVAFEEKLSFAHMSDEYVDIIGLIKGVIGSQVTKLMEIPDSLDEVVSLIGEEHEGTVENPYIIRRTITFDVPEDWERKMNREIKKLNRLHANESDKVGSGYLWTFLFVTLVLWLIS